MLTIPIWCAPFVVSRTDIVIARPQYWFRPRSADHGTCQSDRCCVAAWFDRAPAYCKATETRDTTVYVDDCGHMVANATGCIPKPGQAAASSPDGMIALDGKVVHECVVASATTGCNTACCVNPQVTALRKSQEVRASTCPLWAGPAACLPACLPLRRMTECCLFCPRRRASWP
jgi:hypothetical protein